MNDNLLKETAEVGVVIGRFQTPYLHAGHLEIIQHVIDAHPRVFIFIGQTLVQCTHNDPLDFYTRRAMIEDAFPEVEVHRIDDMGDDDLWSHELDRQIGILAPMQKVVLYGSRDSFIKSYKGKYPTKELKATHYVSGTEIRKSIGVRSKRTQEFREGAVWITQNQWPHVNPTVDMAVISHDSKSILLGGKKKDPMHLWRFPGGFADTFGDSYEDDAMRELVEETHVVARELIYIGSKLIDDERYRNQVDKIKTIFFAITDWEGEAKAGDDLCRVKWFDINNLTSDLFVPTHKTLFCMFQDFYFKMVATKCRESLDNPLTI